MANPLKIYSSFSNFKLLSLRVYNICEKIIHNKMT